MELTYLRLSKSGSTCFPIYKPPTPSHPGAIALMVSSATSDMPTAPRITYLVSRQGYDIGEALPPLPELDDQERARLDTCYDRVTECVDNDQEHGT